MTDTLDWPSPNHDDRGGALPDMLVLHYTGMESARAALDRLADPAAKVSAHYCIDEDGRLYRMVDEERRAWHAGVACWRGHRDINARSIGIELVNPGHEFGYRPFPAAQMATLIALCRDIVGRHPIAPRNVVGHSDVAPARKQDPGELFDWRALAGAGIGFWPDLSALPDNPGGTTTDAGDRARRARLALGAIGYCLDPEEESAPALTAFQRHFRPARCDGRLDDETLAVLEATAEQLEYPAADA